MKNGKRRESLQRQQCSGISLAGACPLACPAPLRHASRYSLARLVLRDKASISVMDSVL